ncbi:MAG: cytochrome c biogenesis CcdA family protein [Acidimicrobiia bacterium]
MELAPIALLAGLISITSPCCLPLIPGYLSYMSGVTAGADGQKGRVLGASSLFVLGFASIFTALGASASLAGAVLLGALPVLVKVAGVFVILMGLAMLGILRLPFVYKEKRFDLSKVRSGPMGAFPLGMAFAFGWTPCIGPILATILTAAAATQTAAQGAALLAIYSLGMGIPFMLIALGYSRAGKTVSFLKRHALKIERAGGVLMVFMGVLLITGYWTRLFVPLIRLFSRSGWPPI